MAMLKVFPNRGASVHQADSDEEEYAWWDTGVTRTKS